MAELRSSNIASADYNEERRALAITFKSGAVYSYSDVDQSVYDGLISAQSPGSYFAQNVKDKFSFVKG